MCDLATFVPKLLYSKCVMWHAMLLAKRSLNVLEGRWRNTLLCEKSKEFLYNFGNFKHYFRDFLVNICGNAECMFPICGADTHSLVFNAFALPTMPNKFCIISYGTLVLAHIKLPILSGHVMPWLQTICMSLSNDAHLHPTFYPLTSVAWFF